MVKCVLNRTPVIILFLASLELIGAFNSFSLLFQMSLSIETNLDSDSFNNGCVPVTIRHFPKTSYDKLSRHT
jgi:hypothetical protein